MPNKSNEEIINFLKAFELLLQNSEEFASRYLKSRGYDPEESGNLVEEFASKLILKKKAEFAKKSLAEIYQRAKKMIIKISNAPDSELTDIQSLLNKKLHKKYALNFRELKEMDKTEAVKILTDIEILELLEQEYGSDNDNTKE